MSRWLKSVGNLLDGLDGSAENIVPTSRSAIGQILSRRGYENGESFSGDEEEWDEEGSDFEDFSDEEVVDLDAHMSDVAPLFPDVSADLVLMTDVVNDTLMTRAPEMNEDKDATMLEEKSQPKLMIPSGRDTTDQAAPKDDMLQKVMTLEIIPSPSITTTTENITPFPTLDFDEPTEMADATKAKDSKRVAHPAVMQAPLPLQSEQPTQPATVSRTETELKPMEVLVKEHKLDVTELAEKQTARTAPRSAPLPPASGNSSCVMVDTPPASGNHLPPIRITENAMMAQLQKDIKKCKSELKKNKTEAQSLRKHVLQLNTELEHAETEVQAQREELQRAAERMERDRMKHNEDREDLMDEHEEEVESQKEHYEQQLVVLKEQYEEQIEELEERLSKLDEKLAQEGGDWTKELEDSVQREREAIKKLSETKTENAALKSSLSKIQTQQDALQVKVENLTQALQVANERERQAEDNLDAAKSIHTRQLGQRQSREAELERTISDLGAALNLARQREKHAVSELRAAKKIETSLNFKEEFEATLDELESIRVQFMMETQRCNALKTELKELSIERQEEASDTHERQRHYDREVADLRAQLNRMQQSSKSIILSAVDSENDPSDTVMTLVKEAEKNQQQLTEMSDQLFKQQRLFERSKSEILALKGRVIAEKARADNAETALTVAQSSSNTFDVEDGVGTAYGGAMMRRRFKGGRGNRGKTTNKARSIRSALDLGPGRVSENMETVAMTVDAVDSFVLDTGGLLRQEPLARLFFLFYLFILHLWSFCLVIFHAHSYEQVHGDLGTLSETGGFGPARLLHARGQLPEQP